MKMIVGGAMAWDNEAAIRRELARLPQGSLIISGDCEGADLIAETCAQALGHKAIRMHKNQADRQKYKRLAWQGLNERMLAEGVDLVLIFHPAIEASRGSKHLRDLALGAGIAVQVFSS